MKILSPNPNTQLPVIRKMLWVLKPTYFHPSWEKRIAGGRVGEFDFYRLPFLRKILVSSSVIQQTKTNPRSIGYMLQTGLDIFRRIAPDGQIDLLPDKNAEAQIDPAMASQFRHIWRGQNDDFRPWKPNVSSALLAERYDIIAFLYADAIGRGWLRIESRMRKLGAQQILVLNGRKRAFVFDAAVWRKLLWRRFLEETWIVEIVMAPALFLFGLILAAYDLTVRKLITNNKNG